MQGGAQGWSPGVGTGQNWRGRLCPPSSRHGILGKFWRLYNSSPSPRPQRAQEWLPGGFAVAPQGKRMM